MGGTAAARKPAPTAMTPTTTVTTAAHRGTRCRHSQATTGSRLAAMNSARPMRISIDRALMTSSITP